MLIYGKAIFLLFIDECGQIDLPAAVQLQLSGAGMNTLVLAPELDNRYGVGKVTSRIGLEADAQTFTPERSAELDLDSACQ